LAFLIVAAIVVAVAMTVSFQMTPKYTATATLLLEPRQEQVVDLGAVMSGLPPDATAVDSQVVLLESRVLAKRVADELNLYEDAEFNSALRDESPITEWIDDARTRFMDLLPQGQPAGFDLEAPVTNDPEQERVVASLLGSLSVRRQGLTYAMDISVTSEHRRKAARIANAYAEAYLLEQYESKFEATQRATNWLSGRLQSLAQEVQAAESAVEAYRSQAGLLNAEGSTLTEQQVSDLNGQIILAQTELAGARAELDQVRRQIAAGRQEEISVVQANDIIGSLRGQRSAAIQERADLLSRYREQHPEVINIDRQIADIDREIEQEANRIVAGLESEVVVLEQRLVSLESSQNSFRGQLSENNQQTVRLRELERDAQAKRTLYESFLNRSMQTSEQETLLEPDARIISPAPIPGRASSPNLKLNLLLGLAFAGVAGLATVFGIDAFDRGIHSTIQAERILGVPALGLIPTVPKKYVKQGRAADYVLDKPLSGYAESLRSLRASLLFTRGRSASKVVTITSALPGEGKTTTSLALARVSAMLGSPTIVVDADIRRRSLTKSNGLQPAAGLMELLRGEATLRDVVVRDQNTGLDILPLSATNVRATDIFGRQEMKSLLQQLRDFYELVVIDTPPALPVAETRILATHVDSVVLVARWRKTPREVVLAALNDLQQAQAPIAGIALIQVDVSKESRYGETYGKYYHNSYKKYYSD
jgi:exopolysaccharide transport family protein